MSRQELPILFFILTVAACSTQSWQEASQNYEDWIKSTAGDKGIHAAKAISAYKRKMLGEIDGFEYEERLQIYQTVDGIADRLRKSPESRDITNTSSQFGEKTMSLRLLDRDLDRVPDQFAYLQAGERSTQEFGFMFDLNKDGRMDYLVFNGGPAITSEAKMYWMNYHWIDSNYDGKVDIKVNNAVSPDSGRLPDSGITAWIYDSDFDGYADKAEYLGPGIVEPIRENNGILTVNWFHNDRNIVIGADLIGEDQNRILADINAALH